jgi:hypothetical protein
MQENNGTRKKKDRQRQTMRTTWIRIWPIIDIVNCGMIKRPGFYFFHQVRHFINNDMYLYIPMLGLYTPVGLLYPCWAFISLSGFYTPVGLLYPCRDFISLSGFYIPVGILYPCWDFIPLLGFIETISNLFLKLFFICRGRNKDCH